MEKQVHIRVTGKVQGVYFRKYTQDKAQELALTGWVQNKQDGSVAIYAAGPENKVDDLIAFCHLGSPAADVESVEVIPASEKTESEGFNIRRTT